MKKVLFGIFAHPADEAFLPSGSFTTWVNERADLHLICATKGEKGQNPDNVTDLGEQRCKEWKHSGELMGAKSQTQLGFPDGGICNELFHEISQAILNQIKNTLDTYSGNISVQLITYENCGITGHLDHIAISFITAYVFKKLREDKSKNFEPQLLYACACEAISPDTDTSFVFMPKGHNHEDIDLTINVQPVLEQKKQVMRAHISQRSDAEAIIARLGPNLEFEHFNYFKD